MPDDPVLPDAPDTLPDDLPPFDEAPAFEPDAFAPSAEEVSAADGALSSIPGLPHDLEAEQALLGALLLTPGQFDTIDGRVDEDDFFAPAHGAVFRAMAALVKRGQPLDALLLRAELERAGDLQRVGGAAGVGALLNVAGSGAHVEHYAEVVREKAVLRRLIGTANDMIRKATDPSELAAEVVDFAERSVMEVASRGVSTHTRPIEKVVSDLWATSISPTGVGKRGVTGLATGFLQLDELTTGLHNDELIIVAGRPAMGKSTFALNMLRNIALREKAPCAFFTLEMSSANVASHLMVAEARVDAQKMRKMNLTLDDINRLHVVSETLTRASIWLDETPAISLAQLRGTVRRLAAAQGLRLVMVDYLQLMTASANAQRRSREQEVSEISRGLKALAKDLHIPVVALAQLSRKPEDRKDFRPIMSDLRESGAIEQDADVIMLLHRPSYYNKDDRPGVAEVIVAKQRNGPTDTVSLTFLNDILRFENLSSADAFGGAGGGGGGGSSDDFGD